MVKTLILPTDFDQCDSSDLGGKASQLLRLKQAGFNVPDFFVIPGDTIALIINPIRDEIEPQLSQIKGIDDPQLFPAAQKIKAAIISLAIPETLEREILRVCEGLFGANYFVAVRSSAAAEDGAKASFAGQHESHLFVGAADLLLRIRESIASAWSFGALSYRLAQGIPIMDITYAIVIQRMVDAEKSGIGFSMDINGNLADMIVVAGYGLGEGIVADKVEADTFTIDRQHLSIHKNCVGKHSQIRYVPGKGIVALSVDPALSAMQVLNDEEILQVFDQIMKAEQLLNFPADVEFSFDNNGQLFLLQMRPITTLDLRKIEILDNTNIVESYPGITLPLSFSFALEAYERVFIGSSKAFWVSNKTIQKNELVFQNLIAHYYGRIYYRLDNWYKMLSLVHSSARSMEAWEKAVGLTKSERDKVPFTFQKRVKTFFSMLYLLLNYKRGNKHFFKKFAENYKFLRTIKPDHNNPKMLWQHYETAAAKLFEPWYVTLVNDFLAFKFFGWLQDLTSKFKLSETASLANDLLCGIGGVESEEAILNLLKLKGAVQADPMLKALFEKSDAAILSTLNSGYFPDFYTLLQQHLERYGDRTLAELKLETPSLRNHPLLFIRLLKNQLSTTIGIEDFQVRQKAIRAQAQAVIQANLKWWNPKTYVFNFVRNMAAYGLKSRENMRFCRTRAYGAVKEIFLEIGKLMVKANRISIVPDVFYLSVSELKDFCKNGATDSKIEHIKTIKSQFKNYEALQLPDRVIYQQGHIPIQSNSKNLDKTHAKVNQGMAVSKGVVTAEAAIIIDPEPQLSVHGKILVSKMTDPGWVFLMMQAAGLVSEKGSLLSHTAIVGRELGIPVVVGLKDATLIFKNGDLLKLDGSLGTVERI